jgi:uncharacterized protein YkwD
MVTSRKSNYRLGGDKLMKKLALIVAIMMVLLFTVNELEVHGEAQVNDEIKVTINGFLVEFSDVKPIIINGRTLVPVRGVFENLNAHVRWFEDKKSVLIMKEALQIYFFINDTEVSVNQKRFTLDVPATIINGRTMVPLRFISEALGAEVSWDAKSRTVEISVPHYPFAYTKAISLDLLNEKYQNNIQWLIGAPVGYVEHILGKPDRIDLSRYGFEWYIYNSDLEKYLMVGVKNKTVVGLYSNSKHYKINESIGYNTPREEVHELFNLPMGSIVKGNGRYTIGIKNTEDGEPEYEMFDVERRYYATIFYDIHNEGRVTSYMIIDYATEYSLESYYGEPSEELRDSYERQLFDLVNAVRTRENKTFLEFDEKVAAVAREHSKDMSLNDYFDHINLKGENSSDRLRNAGVSFYAAGENIARFHMCPIYAHESLMNSTTGHRENILGDCTHLGTGVYLDSDGIPTYTQNFLLR